MKKVGILTLLYENYNYGGILQAYALNKFLRNEQYDAYDILYAGNNNVIYSSAREKISQYSKIETFKKVAQKIHSRFGYKKIENIVDKRKDLFLEFIEEYIPVTNICTEDNLCELNRQFDYFISGSDQVWNPNCAFSAFLQTFVEDDEKKISYAASISRNELSMYEKQKMIPYIERFRCVSVREKTAEKILTDLGISDVKTVLDPTLLLTKEQWEILISNKPKEKDYVLCYFFSDSKKIRSELKNYCNSHNLDLKYIPFPRQEYQKGDFIGAGQRVDDIGPLEFIELIYNARLVLTDSFHGIALSIVLNKEFFAFERDCKKSKVSMNSRIYDLLDLVGLRNRLLTKHIDISKIINEKIDYSAVNKIISRNRIESKKFLLMALQSDGDKQDEKVATIKKTQSLGFYAAYSKQFVKNSSSGGVFGCLAEEILRNKGIVYGVSFDESFQPVYIRVEKLDDLHLVQGSKYVQSAYTASASFRTVLEDLSNRKQVLFSGTGCSIFALKKYLMSKQISLQNLLTVEIVCHGTPYRFVWERYKQKLEKKYSSKIKNVDFRNKEHGWKNYAIYIEFENGKQYRSYKDLDPYMQLFLSGYSLKDSCHRCRFKTQKREGDITIGDLWAITIPKLKYREREGLSLVAINSEKGMEIFSHLEELERQELRPCQRIVALKNMMQQSDEVEVDKRDQFLIKTREEGFDFGYKFYKKSNAMQVCIANIKGLIRKLFWRCL